jgi:hypothetical protein
MASVSSWEDIIHVWLHTSGSTFSKPLQFCKRAILCFSVSLLHHVATTTRQAYPMWSKKHKHDKWFQHEVRHRGKTWVFHGGDYAEWCLLGGYSVWLL